MYSVWALGFSVRCELYSFIYTMYTNWFQYKRCVKKEGVLLKEVVWRQGYIRPVYCTKLDKYKESTTLQKYKTNKKLSNAHTFH